MLHLKQSGLEEEVEVTCTADQLGGRRNKRREGGREGGREGVNEAGREGNIQQM